MTAAVSAFDLITRYGPTIAAKSKQFYNSYKNSRGNNTGRVMSAIQAMKDTFSTELEEMRQENNEKPVKRARKSKN